MAIITNNVHFNFRFFSLFFVISKKMKTLGPFCWLGWCSGRSSSTWSSAFQCHGSPCWPLTRSPLSLQAAAWANFKYCPGQAASECQPDSEPKWERFKFRVVQVLHSLATQHHLESVEVGYSDIFLEYSIYLTTRSICLEYSGICLEYVNPFPIPGICLEYAWHILSESFAWYTTSMNFGGSSRYPYVWNTYHIYLHQVSICHIYGVTWWPPKFRRSSLSGICRIYRSSGYMSSIC